MKPWLWIIAGPNGAGKTSLAGDFLDDLRTMRRSWGSDRPLVKLNADERTLELRALFPDRKLPELNLQAARDTDARLVAMIDTGQDVVVETVLSSPKYQDDVETAQAKGYGFGLIYVSLHPPELSPERVNVRVQKGGHAVDPAKAVERYHRSHQLLTWFAARCDVLFVFDNSRIRSPNDEAVLLASRMPGRRVQRYHTGLNVAVDAALAPLL